MNHRIRKKRMKYDIIKMNPGELLVVKFNLSTLDIEGTQAFYNQIVKIVPETCSVIMIPDELNVSSFTKEEADKYIERVTEIFNKSFGEIEN